MSISRPTTRRAGLRAALASIALAFALLSPTSGVQPASAAPAGEFTLMVVPDPQKYTATNALAATYRAQMQWISDSADDLGTVFVASVGDLVQTVDSATKWARADAAWDILDAGGPPYSVVPGNHDMTAAGAATFYDANFPPSRQSSQPTYGGYLGDPTDGIPDPVNRKNKDSYHLFSAGGIDFLVISLEVDLPVYAVNWAQDVIDAHPDRHVILVTHRWLREDGTRWKKTLYRTDTPLLTPEQAWTQLVRPNCSVFMVLMGHEHIESRRTDANACGQPVFQLMANYQHRENGGDGWLRYYTFRPSEEEIEAFTYSVSRNGGAGEFENDADSHFTLSWDPSGGTTVPPPAEPVLTELATPLPLRVQPDRRVSFTLRCPHPTDPCNGTVKLAAGGSKQLGPVPIALAPLGQATYTATLNDAAWNKLLSQANRKIAGSLKLTATGGSGTVLTASIKVQLAL